MLFKTLIIDPPWPYGITSKSAKLSGYADKKYSLLSIEDLRLLPINQVMDPDEAYLFMWATGPFLPEALSLFPSWGFKFITSAVWTKSTGLGVGYWLRGDHEHILIGKRKNAASKRIGARSVFRIDAPRTRHSVKPDFLHEAIEKGGPHIKKFAGFPGPYLEIFGRRLRAGWTILGNEVEGGGDDIRHSLAALVSKCTQIN